MPSCRGRAGARCRGCLSVRFPDPPSEPGVRVSTHPALHQPPACGCRRGLDPQYPCARRAGIHQRPPALPVPPRPARCLPSPCGRLSRPRTTTKAPPRPTTTSRRHACPHGAGDLGRFPRSPVTDRRGRRPAMPRQPRHEYAAAFLVASWPAHLYRRRSRPSTRRSCTADRPISTRLEPAPLLRSLTRWFLSYAFSPCLPDPGRLAVPARPVVVRTAPTLSCVSKIGLSSASPACCDRSAAEPLQLRSVTWRLVAHGRPGVDRAPAWVAPHRLPLDAKAEEVEPLVDVA